jgi:hypothetical protein
MVGSDGSATNLIHGTGAFGTVILVRPDGSVLTGGSMGVGTFSPARTLHVNGRARVGSIPPEASTGTVCFNPAGDLVQCGSSLRFKTNVKPFVRGLDLIRLLRPISYDWRNGSGHDIGLAAEDVAQVAPSFTFKDDKGQISGVKYERLSIVLINAVKEQQKQIEQMRSANAKLTARIRTLENRQRKLSSSYKIKRSND